MSAKLQTTSLGIDFLHGVQVTLKGCQENGLSYLLTVKEATPEGIVILMQESLGASFFPGDQFDILQIGGLQLEEKKTRAVVESCQILKMFSEGEEKRLVATFFKFSEPLSEKIYHKISRRLHEF